MPIVSTGNYVPKSLRESSGGVVTTQGFVEYNVKNGTQFSTSSYLTGLTGNQVLDTIISTGDKPVIIKSQEYEYNGDGLTIEWFKDPVFTGGSNITAGIFNQKPSSTTLTSITLTGVKATDPSTLDFSLDNTSIPTVTFTGTAIQPLITLLGDASKPKKGSGTGRVAGLDLILEPNSVYLFRKTSLSSDAQSISGFSTWYEGEYNS